MHFIEFFGMKEHFGLIDDAFITSAKIV